MPYSYVDHVSDVCIRAEGKSLAGAMEAGVEAMLNVMFGLEAIGETVSVAINAEAREPELLFVEVLNEVVSQQGLGELALRRIETHGIKEENGRLIYSGTAYGERFDRARHAVRTEVKGATYSALTYNKGEGGTHVLTCVLDV
ncbi:MAG: archease [Deltaproteobacteria bacterium]|nr:archease [Deltaproteobacteria bacterium]